MIQKLAMLLFNCLCSKFLLKSPVLDQNERGNQASSDVAKYSQACLHVQETYMKLKFILRPNTSSQKVLSSLLEMRAMRASTCSVCVRVSMSEHQ